MRAGGPGDVVDVARVQVETWRAAYAGLVPAESLARLDVAERVRGWLALQERGVRLLVAEADGVVVGYASSGASRDEDAVAGVGELYALYVLPGWWRHGVGRRLHDAALQELADERSTVATLWVLAGNERGRGFYAALGWRPDGAERQEQVPGGVLEEVRLTRPVEVSPRPRRPGGPAARPGSGAAARRRGGG